MARLLWEVGRRSFRKSSQYRLAAASGVVVNTIFGFLRAAVLVFVAESNGGEVRGLTADELATFAFVSQGFIMIIGAFGETELAERIRTGDIVIDLYRPVDLQLWWLATWLGRSAFQVLARGIPPVALGAVFFDLVWPDHGWQWLAFAVTVALASMIGFAVRFMSNLSSFWLLDNRGVDQLVTILISFFAGLTLPIALFPSWLETLARLLPFAAMLQLPTEIYLGLHDGPDALWVIGQQLIWCGLLFSLGRLMLRHATTRLVVQGG